MSQLFLWPSPESAWWKVADRFPTAPPPPVSETRIRLGMLRGAGERHETCSSYGDCIGRAARAFDGQAHCPKDCGSRSDLSRAELVFLATNGSGRSPIAEFESVGEKRTWSKERRQASRKGRAA